MTVRRRVDQYSVDGEFLMQHESLTAAGLHMSTCKESIMNSCNDGRIIKGFIWKYSDYPDLEGEDWLDHPCLPIRCSNLGRIQNANRVKMFGPSNGDGYLSVMVKGKKYKVHRLIAETWKPYGLAYVKLLHPEIKPQVDHLNHIRDDNRMSNLHWVTPAQNCKRIFSVSAALARHQKNTE